MMEVAGHALYSTIQELTYDERSRYIDEYSDLMNQKIPLMLIIHILTRSLRLTMRL